MGASVRVGIIGGSGLGDALGAMGEGVAHEVDTPFGRPSGPIHTTEVEGVPVALLARHGPGHLHNPSRVPYRANLYALKSLGVTHVLASGAVGSLREHIAPRHLVLPDQVIDRTYRRPSTFFEEMAVHVEMTQPFCSHLRELLTEAAQGMDVPLHTSATYVCMEGPQLSTRAESLMHRQLGGDLIGMTAMPEAKLAREAELCYALVALPTDYDCWRPHTQSAGALLNEIVGNLRAATSQGLSLIRRVLPRIVSAPHLGCSCACALSMGIWSDRQRVPAEVWQRYPVLLDRYAPRRQ
jgi:5'-methylthioadenosine phosphorylase